MLLWLNGALGVGKTTAAQCIRDCDPRWRAFDPETVGHMLRANLAGVPLDDFQDLPAWRILVPAVAHEVMMHTHADLVVVQTVLNQHYWLELRAGLAERRLEVVHVLLDADSETLRARIAADQNETAAPWRLQQLPSHLVARSRAVGRVRIERTDGLPIGEHALRFVGAGCRVNRTVHGTRTLRLGGATGKRWSRIRGRAREARDQVHLGRRRQRQSRHDRRGIVHRQLCRSTGHVRRDKPGHGHFHQVGAQPRLRS